MKLQRDVRAAMGPELRTKFLGHPEKAAALVASLNFVNLMIRW